MLQNSLRRSQSRVSKMKWSNLLILFLYPFHQIFKYFKLKIFQIGRPVWSFGRPTSIQISVEFHVYWSTSLLHWSTSSCCFLLNCPVQTNGRPFGPTNPLKPFENPSFPIFFSRALNPFQTLSAPAIPVAVRCPLGARRRGILLRCLHCHLHPLRRRVHIL